jgi:hypothetical protein
MAKSRKSKAKPAARSRKKPAPRRAVFKASSWYASAARAIAISGETRLSMQD